MFSLYYHGKSVLESHKLSTRRRQRQDHGYLTVFVSLTIGSRDLVPLPLVVPDDRRPVGAMSDRVVSFSGRTKYFHNDIGLLDFCGRSKRR